MDSSSPAVVSGDGHTSGTIVGRLNPAGKRLQCRRSQSSSSSSTCSSPFSSPTFSSSSEDSPITPVAASIKLAGIPFSWEQHPGIPKKPFLNIKDPSSLIVDLLPLPPPAFVTTSTITTRKFDLETIFAIHQKRSSAAAAHQRSYKGADPFLAALMKCSEENREEVVADTWHRSSGRASRDRLSVIDRYVSCKSSCAAIEPSSMNPRSRRTAYGVIRKL